MGFVANYLWNLASVAAGRQPVRPLLFSYYVTHRCNLNCRYCSDGDGKRFKEDPVAELATAEAKRLLTILRRSADTLDVTGGEPMIREDLEEILAHARVIGLRTVLNTKGVGLRQRPDLVRLSDTLVLSIDTLDGASLAGLIGRPREAAERILDALRFAMGERQRTGTQVVISAVATPENLADVGAVLRFAIESGLAFHVSPEIVGTRVNPALRQSDGYRGLIAEVLAAKRTARGVLGVPQYLRGIGDFRTFRCHPLLMPVIRPDGRMYYPCLESKRAEVSVLETGDYGAALREVRRRAGEIPVCRDCCHLFCHMALSLFQRHPLAAMGEWRHWRSSHAGQPAA
ncbi:MAG: radical SAM protein [Planctomycetota bacterium]|nr:radical SAM protein [Planctomycetota bacterium]